MDSGFYAACAGLVSRMDALETIANNLANASTTGFHARHNVFNSVLAGVDGSQFSTLNQDINDYGALSGTQVDASQGSLTHTGNPLDLAIEGPGYFAVQTSAGPMYTRAGSLHVSSQGILVTSAGDPVLGDKGPIQIVGSPVNISADGTLSVDGAVAGRIKLVEFPPSVALQNAGANYLASPAGVGSAATASSVSQGMLESSNVNPIASTVEMIEAQRDVESMRRALTMFNTDMDKTAAQDIARVG